MVTVVVSEGLVKVGRLKKLTDVPAGGAVIYLGSTIHFAGTNATDD